MSEIVVVVVVVVVRGAIRVNCIGGRLGLIP